MTILGGGGACPATAGYTVGPTTVSPRAQNGGNQVKAVVYSPGHGGTSRPQNPTLSLVPSSPKVSIVAVTVTGYTNCGELAIIDEPHPLPTRDPNVIRTTGRGSLNECFYVAVTMHSYAADSPGDLSTLYDAHWRDLDATTARRYASAFVFFSARAFHYFAPMWLRAILVDLVQADVAVEGTLCAFSVAHEGRLRERLALFTLAQAKATLGVLELVFGRPLPWHRGAGQLARAREQLAPIAPQA